MLLSIIQIGTEISASVDTYLDHGTHTHFYRMKIHLIGALHSQSLEEPWVENRKPAVRAPKMAVWALWEWDKRLQQNGGTFFYWTSQETANIGTRYIFTQLWIHNTSASRKPFKREAIYHFTNGVHSWYKIRCRRGVYGNGVLQLKQLEVGVLEAKAGGEPL